LPSGPAAEAIARAEAAETALPEQSRLGNQHLEAWRSRAEDAERWRKETEASFNELVSTMREAVELSTEARLLVEAGKWQQASDAAMDSLRQQPQAAIESARVQAAASQPGPTPVEPLSQQLLGQITERERPESRLKVAALEAEAAAKSAEVRQKDAALKRVTEEFEQATRTAPDARTPAASSRPNGATTTTSSQPQANFPDPVRIDTPTGAKSEPLAAAAGA